MNRRPSSQRSPHRVLSVAEEDRSVDTWNSVLWPQGREGSQHTPLPVHLDIQAELVTIPFSLCQRSTDFTGSEHKDGSWLQN